MQFSIIEKAILYSRAGATLTDKGLDKKEVVEVLETLTQPNVLRLALGFDQRERGGRRSGAGWPKGKKRKVKK